MKGAPPALEGELMSSGEAGRNEDRPLGPRDGDSLTDLEETGRSLGLSFFIWEAGIRRQHRRTPYHPSLRAWHSADARLTAWPASAVCPESPGKFVAQPKLEPRPRAAGRASRAGPGLSPRPSRSAGSQPGGPAAEARVPSFRTVLVHGAVYRTWLRFEAGPANISF